MPALSVSIDGNTIATVNTDEFNVLNVQVGGTLVDEHIAMLNFAGGFHPETGESTYLTWIDQMPLQIGQVVVVTFAENAQTSQKGKTIEELYPNDNIAETIDFKPLPEAIKEIKAMQKQREKVIFRVVLSNGDVFVGNTTPKEHGFGFSVLWNAWQPERASVSLHSYTLENLESRTSLNDLAKEKIPLGSKVQFELLT
jgi:hypothetical protein